jgi:hypothetical protein
MSLPFMYGLVQIWPPKLQEINFENQLKIIDLAALSCCFLFLNWLNNFYWTHIYCKFIFECNPSKL